MKKMKLLVCAVLVASLVMGIAVAGSQSVSAKTKKVSTVIIKMTNKKISYKKIANAKEYLGSDDWGESLIGIGKTKKVKIAKKCKFYRINFKKGPKSYCKISKKKLIKLLKGDLKPAKETEKGKTFYAAVAFTLTIKKGKVVKVKEIYEP